MQPLVHTMHLYLMQYFSTFSHLCSSSGGALLILYSLPLLKFPRLALSFTLYRGAVHAEAKKNILISVKLTSLYVALAKNMHISYFLDVMTNIYLNIKRFDANS